jgi:hypothetical protein
VEKQERKIHHRDTEAQRHREEKEKGVTTDEHRYTQMQRGLPFEAFAENLVGDSCAPLARKKEISMGF